MESQSVFQAETQAKMFLLNRLPEAGEGAVVGLARAAEQARRGVAVLPGSRAAGGDGGGRCDRHRRVRRRDDPRRFERRGRRI